MPQSEPTGIEGVLSEPVSKTFATMRTDIGLYERGEVSFKSLLRGLRKSMADLEAREVKRA